MAGFYSARDSNMPPLLWPSIAPPFTDEYTFKGATVWFRFCRRSAHKEMLLKTFRVILTGLKQFFINLKMFRFRYHVEFFVLNPLPDIKL